MLLMRTHEHDVPHVARVHPGAQLLAGGEDGRDVPLVVLEIAQVLFADLAVIGRNAVAVVRVGMVFSWLTRSRIGQRMRLVAGRTPRLLRWSMLLRKSEHAVALAMPLISMVTLKSSSVSAGRPPLRPSTTLSSPT
jgi:hypothetical protein